MRALLRMLLTVLVVCFLVGCQSPGGTGSNSTPTPNGTSVPFGVSSVDLTVSPDSIAGTTCGSSVTFTYTATFHIPAGTAGGTIQFAYTMNNGRSSTTASVIVGPGETTKAYTFTSSGTLTADHTYPGTAEIMVTSPNTVTSPQITPSGTCGTAAPFQVTSVDLAVSPDSASGMTCGNSVSFTYTATFHIAAGGPGGTIQFSYTVNNGRSQTNASVIVSQGQTTKTYTFTSSGNVGGEYAYPGVAQVLVTSPNVARSPQVQPSGSCSAAAFQVTSVDMEVSPPSIADLACGTRPR